jgi:hypothetical protein
MDNERTEPRDPLSLPEAIPHPLKGDDQQATYLRATFLASLCQDYAQATRKLIDGVLAREDPRNGGNAESLLAVVAAQDVVRIATTMAKNKKMPQLCKDAIEEQLQAFTTAHPHLKTARDVIEHVDEYMESQGRNSEHWFDTTTRFGRGAFIFRVSGSLDLDMVKLVPDIEELADIVRRSVAAWYQIDRWSTAYENARIVDAEALVDENGKLAEGWEATLFGDVDDAQV